MSRTRQSSARPQRESTASRWTPEILTRLAMLLALAVVVARLTYSDGGRYRDEGTGSESRSTTAAGAIGMDLLACVPAILVLARRVSDRQYVLRWSWAALPLFLFAGWSAASVAWSGDKFGAVLGASRWVAAAALFWAAMQLVRSWLRLRLVAALAAGLLLALFLHALIYRTVDVPDLKDFWNKYACRDHPQIRQDSPGTCPKDGKPLVSGRQILMAAKGWSEDSFMLRQFEKKLLSGEAYGFFKSPNTFGAVTTLGLLVILGMALQRMRDDRADRAWIALLVLLPLGGWILYETQSKTAAATAILGVVALLAAWRWREALVRNSRRAFWIGAGALALGAAAVIGHGLAHNTLFHTSLTFRWHYWVGGMRAFAGHPILGVGAENFGLHYLANRLPEAPEEVKDPHNFLVKSLVELGLVGAILALAWLGRTAWELTRPIVPPEADPGMPARRYDKALGTIVLICGLAVLLNIVLSVDFTGSGDQAWFVFNELLKRALLLAMLIIGTTVAAVRSLKGQELDDRPAPILLYAIICGLGMFVLHNMIDFPMSENGPLLLFMLLAGCALGIRHPSIAGRKKHTAAAAAALGVSLALWLVAAGFVWAPTLIAEEAAADAALALRLNRPHEAERLYNRAYESQPLEADFAFRAARALETKEAFDPEAPALLATAIRTNPLAAEYYLERARYVMRANNPALRPQIESDFEKAIALNPNEIDLHVEYGDALASFKTPAAREKALAQYRRAIELNDRYKEDEPRKRRGKDLAAITERIERLGK